MEPWHRRWKDILYLVTPPVLWQGLRAGARWLSPRSEEGLVQYDLADLLPGILDTTVRLPGRAWRREPGMLPLPELVALAAISAHQHPQLVVEIGTYRGSSTLVLALNTPPEAEIFTLDLPCGTRDTRYPLDIGEIASTPFRVGERYQESAVEGKIRQLYGDSATFDFSPWHGRAELVFVDGNHAYENVLVDTATAFRCLAPGGVIVWDDYHPDYGPGVMRALHAARGRKICALRGTRMALYVDAIGRHGE